VLGLPDGRAPARRAVRPVRRRDVESCFDAIIDRTTETYRREILGKIPVGSWVWEDYAEHDGVDEPMLHTQRITLTRTAPDDPDGERLILDFDGTGRRPRARSTTAATTATASSSRSGWRRSCATSPTPRSGWPSSTSTRASCR
jgi:N-methylhydantoinase B/oxoprolinase/acetone carboxylase alpha subunit